MATVEDGKIPYEILIRFGDDGLPKGAHAKFIRRIKIDGEIIKEDIGSAEPLNIEGFQTSALMSDTTRDALAEVSRLSADAVNLNKEMASLRAELIVRADELDRLKKAALRSVTN